LSDEDADFKKFNLDIKMSAISSKKIFKIHKGHEKSMQIGKRRNEKL
jgi:hypothetical protein